MNNINFVHVIISNDEGHWYNVRKDYIDVVSTLPLEKEELFAYLAEEWDFLSYPLLRDDEGRGFVISANHFPEDYIRYARSFCRYCLDHPMGTRSRPGLPENLCLRHGTVVDFIHTLRLAREIQIWLFFRERDLYHSPTRPTRWDWRYPWELTKIVAIVGYDRGWVLTATPEGVLLRRPSGRRFFYRRHDNHRDKDGAAVSSSRVIIGELWKYLNEYFQVLKYHIYFNEPSTSEEMSPPTEEVKE